MMMDTLAQSSVIIVGGGLSGLAAAAILARGGHTVTVFEKASIPGGRAITKQHGEFFFNLGAHALYAGGPGEKLLKELGVHYNGFSPVLKKALAFDAGKLYTLPMGVTSILGTKLLSPGAKAELVRFYSRLMRVKPETLQDVSVQDWLEQQVRHPQARHLMLALVRLVSYSHAPDMVSAGLIVSLLQAQVLYLDGGWQTLVDGLRAVAQAAGAKIVAHARVESVEVSEERHTVRLANGDAYGALAVLLAVDPQTASALLLNGEHKELQGWAKQSVPAHAACFDVALRRLPDPQHLFALGIDRPLYYSVHSTQARLAPEGGALIHTLKYLQPDVVEEPASSRQELEALLDVVQPGWRAEVVEQYFLPHMTASNAIIQARQGGMSGRPGPLVPGIRNLYIAGDWVGPEGQLADACFASADSAARMIMLALAESSDNYITAH